MTTPATTHDACGPTWGSNDADVCTCREEDGHTSRQTWPDVVADPLWRPVANEQSAGGAA